MNHTRQRHGAIVDGAGVSFRVWAPAARQVELVLEDGGDAHPMQASAGGCFECRLDGVRPGARYRFQLDGGPPLPDPASRFQPEGVHGPSEVIDPGACRWSDSDWNGIEQRDLVFYELHVGTFTAAGTFRAAIEKLPYLRDLGVTAIELMPVADFPGRWNWGYDPASLYAPSRTYGRPEDLRAFVDAAHQQGLAVFLDVIYNHLGPDGAYAAAFGKFFTDRHSSPWGQGINLDDEHSDGVRAFFIDNALHWLEEYHFDGLRLDATHALLDDSPQHFLAELREAIDAIEGPRRLLIAEDERNLATVVRSRAEGGYGLDAVWADDFHHQVRNICAGDEEAYFVDFAEMTADDLTATLRQGWFYTGQLSKHGGGPRGTDPAGLPPERFVICIQNHDQVGNRPTGARLHHEAPLPLYRAASALLLFAPELPLLFMGQEWGAGTPFQFFTDHNQELGALVTAGRKREFQGFAGFEGEVPDPQAPATFERSRLDWSELEEPAHAGLLQLYRDLLALRRCLTGAAEIETLGERSLQMRRGQHVLFACFEPRELSLPSDSKVVLSTESARYGGDGSPSSDASSAFTLQHGGAVIVELDSEG